MARKGKVEMCPTLSWATLIYTFVTYLRLEMSGKSIVSLRQRLGYPDSPGEGCVCAREGDQ